MIDLLDHNRTAYEAVREQLNETGKACVVHPTGTGKSFIAFKWVEDNPDKEFLWLGPSENIYQTQLENVMLACSFVPENVCFMTYAKLAIITNEELINIKPDCICFDEAHRAGAKTWQQGVNKLLDTYPNAQILGLTATPIRYLDKQRNIAEELFDGYVADSMTLGETIARGILPAPKYVISLYSIDGNKSLFDQELKNYRDRIRRSSAAVRKKAEQYLEKLRRALEKAIGLDEIFAKHLTRGKYLVFCANIEHMREMTSKVHEWFGVVDSNPHVYNVWADSPNAKADYTKFRQDKSSHLRLMFCIDMFNEGIHIEDIDGVILFRPTVSPIIYKQQIGRALSTMKRGTPLIIDAVNNFENLYSISSIQTEMHQFKYLFNHQHEVETETSSFQIIDEVCECRQIISQLEELLSFSWDQMYLKAREYYETHGNLEIERRYKTSEGIPLGQWVFTQRAVYNGNKNGLLDEQRISRLNAIGMNWNNKIDTLWEKGYEHAKAYKDKYGDLIVIKSFVCEDGYCLGSWISEQRHQISNKLKNGCTDERIIKRFQMLDALGMVWNRNEMAFEVGLFEATQYKAIHGDLDVPYRYVTPNGYKLGSWISNVRLRFYQQSKRATLSDEQIGRLETLGIKWKPDYLEQQWDKCFAGAEKYYREHGNLDIPTGYIQNDFRLDRWIYSQRQKEKAGKLSPEKILKLKSIGYKTVSRNKTWEHIYNNARIYYYEHGDLEVPIDYKTNDGVWLYNWVITQRRDRKQGKLSNLQIQKLDEIGMRWEDSTLYRWRSNLEEVRMYPRNERGLPIVPKDTTSRFGTSLSLWVNKQDSKYRQCKLPPEEMTAWKELLQEGD